MKTDHEIRNRYTWHLRAPFTDKFDSDHWWRSQPNSDPAAALYELARRHPRVGNALLAQDDYLTESYKALLESCLSTPDKAQGPALMATVNHLAQVSRKPAAIICLMLCGLRSWPKLSALEQECWKGMAGKLKGVDCRLNPNRLRSIDEEAFFFRREVFALGPVAKRLAEQSVTALSPEAFDRLVEEEINRDQHRPTRQEKESEIALRATLAHRQGMLLFAVAPDLNMEEARRLFVSELRKQQKRRRIEPTKSAQIKHWLTLIAKFEKTEQGTRSRDNAKSDLFKEFRKAVDGIGF